MALKNPPSLHQDRREGSKRRVGRNESIDQRGINELKGGVRGGVGFTEFIKDSGRIPCRRRVRVCGERG
jgi:hypothetical protein